ncbi:MAG TPA: M1 family aminopeptidase, partial [Anaerolineae bacterium]|nr:M1 family aminopeptidase [Anaerolineae bacterium]
LYSAIVYGKAALFFQEVRTELGDETFLAILRAYLNDRRYGIARPEDWLRVAEQVSGQDLTGLYSRWILEAN